jgi:putative ABC transport system permease protein
VLQIDNRRAYRAKQKEVAHYLETYPKEQGLSVRSIDTALVLQEDSAKAITILVSFILVIALLIAFVGSIGLTGTMGLNVLERTREIGVMWAIGAVDFEIMKSVVIEGAMIGLIAWFLAIGLSFPISQVLLKIISQAMIRTGERRPTQPTVGKNPAYTPPRLIVPITRFVVTNASNVFALL